MKRYSLTFQATGDPGSEADLQTAVEDVLLRLHPRYTYRMGRAYPADPRSTVVEIEFEGRKGILLPYIQRIEGKLPVKLEAVRWGWNPDPSIAPKLPAPPLGAPQDPVETVPPAAGRKIFQTRMRWVALRYLAFAALTLVLVFVTVGRFYYERPLWMDLLRVLLYPIWFFILIGTPIDLRALAKRISCLDDGVEIAYWPGGKTVRLPWKDIDELEYNYRGCTIRGGGASIRLLLAGQSGFPDWKTVLATLAARSSLRYAEGTFFLAVYRRPDLP
jgi:hypothetical protein